MEKSCSLVREEPIGVIEAFNKTWCAFLIKLGHMMPSLEESFMDVYVLSQGCIEMTEGTLMYNFQFKTRNSIVDCVGRRDINELVKATDGFLPRSLKDEFVKLSPDQQRQTWNTIQALAKSIRSVYPDYPSLTP